MVVGVELRPQHLSSGAGRTEPRAASIFFAGSVVQPPGSDLFHDFSGGSDLNIADRADISIGHGSPESSGLVFPARNVSGGASSSPWAPAIAPALAGPPATQAPEPPEARQFPGALRGAAGPRGTRRMGRRRPRPPCRCLSRTGGFWPRRGERKFFSPPPPPPPPPPPDTERPELLWLL